MAGKGRVTENGGRDSAPLFGSHQFFTGARRRRDAVKNRRNASGVCHRWSAPGRPAWGGQAPPAARWSVVRGAAASPE